LDADEEEPSREGIVERLPRRRSPAAAVLAAMMAVCCVAAPDARPVNEAVVSMP